MKRAKSDSTTLSRRDVFQAGTFIAASSFLGSTASAAARLPTRGKGPNVYERIGVKPFINCTSTRTMNGGSAALPEVAEAVYEASFYHVNMQELLRTACPRVAELLEVPGAMISSGRRGRAHDRNPRLHRGRRHRDAPTVAQHRGHPRRSGHAALVTLHLRSRHPHDRRQDGQHRDARGSRKGFRTADLHGLRRPADPRLQEQDSARSPRQSRARPRRARDDRRRR